MLCGNKLNSSWGGDLTAMSRWGHVRLLINNASKIYCVFPSEVSIPQIHVILHKPHTGTSNIPQFHSESSMNYLFMR